MQELNSNQLITEKPHQLLTTTNQFKQLTHYNWSYKNFKTSTNLISENQLHKTLLNPHTKRSPNLNKISAPTFTNPSFTDESLMFFDNGKAFERGSEEVVLWVDAY